MGLNNQNLHNFLFRGFLTPWEAYTGAKIKWIDLAQADYNARLQQSIATGTVDFDIIEMGAPFEGDMGVKDLLSEMPDWVMKQIDFDDIVNYLKPPVGTWNGKIHRVTIDSDCHTMNIRTDVFTDPDLAKMDGLEGQGRHDDWGPPKTWQQVQAVTKFLKGKKVKGKEVYGFLDQPKPWGGFRFYFTASRATAYAKYPGEKNWLFDENMKPQVNNPAFVRAIQDVVDALPLRTGRSDQRRSGHNGVPAVPDRHRLAARMVGRHRNGRQDQRHRDDRRRARFRHPARLRTTSTTSARAQWEKLASGPNIAPNMAYLGWGIYVMKTVDGDAKRHKAAWSAAAHLGGKDLSMWTAAYPSGFQPYRKSHTNLDLWALAGYDKKYIGSYMDSQSTSYNHPNSAIEPRIPGIFQYYSIAEDELTEVFAGKETAQQGADNIAAAWDKLTDKLGRDNQVKYYRIAMGLT